MICPDCAGRGDYCGRCFGAGEVELFGMARKQVKKYPIEPVLRALGMDYVPHGSGWVKCKCFHHPDTRASAAVNHQLKAYKCHACVMQGDAIAIVRHVEGMSFAEAVEYCESVAGDGSGELHPAAAERSLPLFG